MQNIYLLFAEKQQKLKIEKEDIPILYSLVDEAIRKALTTEFTNPNRPRDVELVGDYYIIFHILRQYAQNILRMDEQTLPKNLPILEEKKIFTIPFSINGKTEHVRIGGRIDRIDLDNEVVRILDYKSGKIDEKNCFSSIKELFERDNNNRKDYIFQIFLYSYLLGQNEYHNLQVIPELLFIRETYQHNFESGVFVKNNKDLLKVNSMEPYVNDFSEELQSLFHEIFDPSIPYSQTVHVEKCQYCPYVDICHRRE